METSPFGPPYDVLGGTYVDPEINFRFEAWSSRTLEEHEMQQAFQGWRMSLRRTTSLKNKTFRVAYTVLD